MSTTPSDDRHHLLLHCESPETRRDTAHAEGRDDWPFRGFPTTVTAHEVGETFRSYLHAHPGIDHLSFTASSRPRHRPYLQAHLVEGELHVKIAALHNADPHTRAIVHHLHAAVIEEFQRARSATIQATPDIAGLNHWARTVLDRAATDSAEASMARTILDLLHHRPTDPALPDATD